MYCTSLKNIYSLNPVPPFCFYSFMRDLFYSSNVYVPIGSLSAYKNANEWKDFINLQEFNSTGIEEVKANEKNANTVYYDIQGRKLNRPRNGLNIINGKKVIIKNHK